MAESTTGHGRPVVVEEAESVVIRFAGDSGDGMQLTGTQFTDASAAAGNDISTFPDFPAEIRAPAGSLPGVSGYQLHFSSRLIHTPGDAPNVLVAMNPAALKVNLRDLEPGARIIVNSDAFTEQNLHKAGYAVNPLEDGSLAEYDVIRVPVTSLNTKALEHLGLTKKQMDLCKNFWALGLMYWLYDRPMDRTQKWIDEKFKSKPEMLEANRTALLAGFAYGEVGEVFGTRYTVKKAAIDPGMYRKITGNEALALGCVVASKLAGTPLLYASYPITPASDILHELAGYRHLGVRTVQCEDEIAAAGTAIGASFAGALGVTGTSGPGLALKSEAISLAVMTELPLVVLDVQRAGPSTGMPTKTEQADLLQAVFGRHGESPLVVIAAATPADCFYTAIEAFRIAVKHMVPVIVLTDGYLANGAEPWKLPAAADLPKIEVRYHTERENFMPYARDPETLARPWAIPGTPGLEHRIGGLEKQHLTGNVSYDAENHQRMTDLRAKKVELVANDIPPLEVYGDPEGELLVLGWGGTCGPITAAVESMRARGYPVSSAHLRHLHPFPRNLGEVLKKFRRVLIPELNSGQLRFLVRAKYLVDAEGLNKVAGRPFAVHEITQKIASLCEARSKSHV